MKTLKLSNGEIRKGYEYADLSEEVKEKVFSEHYNFLCSMPVSVENEEGELEDSYEDYTDEEVIENMEVNMYLFDEEGELLPTLYHYKGNTHVKTTFGKQNYEVEFI